jgi:hypothetical protein
LEERWRPIGGVSDAATGIGASGSVAVVAELDLVVAEAVSLRTTVAVASVVRMDGGAFLWNWGAFLWSEEADFPAAVEGALERTLPGVAASAGVTPMSAHTVMQAASQGRDAIVRGYRRPCLSGQTGPEMVCDEGSDIADGPLLRLAGDIHPADDQRAE